MKGGKKHKPWQMEALNIKLEPFPWPKQASVSQNPFLITLNTTGSQLASPKPHLVAPPQPAQPVKPTLTQVPGPSSLPMPFSQLSYELFQETVTLGDRCAHQLHIYQFLVTKRQASLASSYSLQTRSGSQSIIIGTGPPRVIIQRKVPSINIVEVRDGVTTTQ